MYVKNVLLSHLTESYGSGSYRYHHYSAYGGDGLKVFNAQIGWYN